MKKYKFFAFYALCLYIVSTVCTENTRTVWTKLSGRVELTCAHPPPSKDDTALLYLWFKNSNTETIYSFDNRGLPESEAHWYEERVVGRRAKFHPTRHPPSLTIDPVVASDEGHYECRVQFKRSPSAYTSVNLSIIIPPKAPVILMKEEEILGHVGPLLQNQRFELVCRVEGGYPNPIINWSHNGRSFVSPMKHHVIAGTKYCDAYLSLAAVRRHHAENFKCETYSQSPDDSVRSDIKSNVATLNITLSPLSVKLTGLERPLSAGTTVRIVCRASGSSPPAQLSLYKDSKPLSETTVSISNGGNSTSLSANIRVTRKDNGISIKCKATNPALPEIQQITSTLTDIGKLNVFYKPHVMLKLWRGLNASNMIEGQDAFMQCLVDANPPPHKIEWFKDGEPLRHSTKLVLRSTDLALQKLERNNSGSYYCVADNLAGKGRSKSLQIDVKHAPVCAQSLNMSQGAAMGRSADIACHVWSNPAANVTFTWSKIQASGRELPVEDNITVKGLSTFLIVSLAHIGEFGTFLCRATNSIGTQKTACRITIEPAGPPFPPEECSANADGDTLEVSCDSGFDGGVPQQFFIDIERNGDIITSESSAVPNWTIEGLEGGVDLKVFIWSQNMKGNSSVLELDVKMPTFNQQSVTGQHVTETEDDTLSSATLYGTVLGAFLVILFLTTVMTLILCRKYRRRILKTTEDDVPPPPPCGPDVVTSVQHRASPYLEVFSPPSHDEWIEGPNRTLNRSPHTSCIRLNHDDAVIQYHASQKPLHRLASAEDDFCSGDEEFTNRISSQYVPVSTNGLRNSVDKTNRMNMRMSKYDLIEPEVSQSLIRKSSNNLLSAKESAV